MDDKAILSLIENALITWRTNQTRARANVSLNSFADYLGVNRSLLSMWLNGERPVTHEQRAKIAKPIAELLGPDAYTVLGITPPNPFLQQIIERFERIPPEKQQKLADDAERYEAESLKNGSKKASKQRKTT